MNNKYNRNVINMIKNNDFYEKDLFIHMLGLCDLNELKNEKFSITTHNETSISGNLESLLLKYKKNSDANIEMSKLLKNKWSGQLGVPKYFLHYGVKDYTIGQGCYDFFTNMSKFLKELKTAQSNFTDSEEKFLIDCFFKDSKNIYLWSLEEKDKRFISSILLNQKEYINEKNYKSSFNNFLGNKEFKKVFSLLSEAEKDSVVDQKISCQEIVNSYYKTLFNKNHHDFTSQVASFSNDELIGCLSVNISDDPEEWFKIFLTSKTGYKMENLKTFSEDGNFLLPKMDYSKKKGDLHPRHLLVDGIKLLKKLSSSIEFSEDFKALFFLVAIEINNEFSYLALRDFLEVPDNKVLHSMIYEQDKKLSGTKIKDIEIELLKDRLEKKLSDKEVFKTYKI